MENPLTKPIYHEMPWVYVHTYEQKGLLYEHTETVESSRFVICKWLVTDCMSYSYLGFLLVPDIVFESC